MRPCGLRDKNGEKRMQLTMLGTGHASVTECYNTCFVIQEAGRYFLVDGGGGNGIFVQLKHAGIRWQDIHEFFVTHKHLDHILGMLWMIRMVCQLMNQGNYEGEAYFYGHDEVIGILRDQAKLLIRPKDGKLIGDRVHLVAVKDGETREIIGHKVTFYDICSSKAKQFGFCMELDDARNTLVCCGDEPYNEDACGWARGCKWMLHEAFCLYSEADIFEPYEKYHSTVKDACEMAQRQQVRNLVLYHTEDTNMTDRKKRYRAEGAPLFGGNLYIPDDLETIEL